MRLQLLVLGGILLFCLNCSGTAISHCTDESILGVISPAAMIDGRDIRQTYGRGYLMINKVYVNQCCGTVKRWAFNVAKSALSNPIQLQVWRPVDSAHNIYLLAGKTDFYAEAGVPFGGDEDDDEDEDESDDHDDDDNYDDHDDEENHSRLVSVSISKEHRISVRSGDVIGWRSPNGDVVSYTTNYYNMDNIVVNRMADIEVGASYEFPSPLRSHRTYGIHAVLTGGTTPVITNLPASVEVRDDVTEGTTIYNVTGNDADPQDVTMFVIPGSEIGATMLPFEIATLTGAVFIKGKLLEPSYDVTVVMTDACGLYDIETLTIIVSKTTSQSKNSLPKIILPQTVDLIVSDKEIDHTYSIVVDDDDGDDVTCIISHVAPHATFFSVRGTDLLVRSSSHMSLGPERIYNVSVTCDDGTATVTSTLRVTLFHHEPPVFHNSSIVLRLSVRAVEVGDVIHVIKASSAEHLLLVFRTDDCHCPFYLHPDGSIVAQRSLMTEDVTSYSLAVYVSDGVVTAGPSSVHLILSDVNRAPLMAQVPSSLLIDENSVGIVLYINVTDADDDHVVLTMDWTPPDAASYFFFNQTGSSIAVRASSILDYEYLYARELTKMTSTITASDGHKTSTANITFVICDVNEPPTCFNSRDYVTVNEGPKGSQASDGAYLTSACHDPENQPLRYSISELSNDDTIFLINASNAILTYAVDVDDNTTILRSFLVVVSDVGGLSEAVEVVVEIGNVPKKPGIQNLPRRIAVSEDMLPGKIFSLLIITEHSANLEVYFKVLEGDPGLFEMQSNNALYLKHSRRFDYEVTSLHVLEFIVDNGYLTSDPAILTLEVMDVNESPEFLQNQLPLIVEEGEEGRMLLSNLRERAVDPDINDTMTFSLLNNHESFEIDSHTGAISFAVEYDVDGDVMPQDVVLLVRAVDSGMLSAVMQVNVKVLNRNESPIIINLPREITLPEDSVSGTVIYRVLAEDPDFDDLVLHASFTGESAKLFHFNQSDGTLTVRRTGDLDFETRPNIILHFSADDGVLTSPRMLLTLHISDVNEAPYFTKDVIHVSTAEGPTGTVIDNGGILSSARDPDGDLLTFDLPPGSRALGFSIDKTSAQLTFAIDFVLTRQTSPLSVNLTVCAVDSRNLSVTAQVQVIVHNRNTRPRLLYLPTNITTPSTTPKGSVLYTALAEDEDGDPLTFHFNTLVGGRRSLFHLDPPSGVLSFTSEFLLGTAHTAFFKLEISVTDGLLGSLPAILGIFIVPEDTSTFTSLVHHATESYVLNVREDELAFPISLPGPLLAESLSQQNGRSYHISGGSGQNYFHIDSSTGNLFFVGNEASVDQSVNKKLTLDIRVVSTDSENSTKTIEVVITDFNDNAPEVDSKLMTFFVSKTSRVGTVVGYIEARDRDSGKNAELTFEIISSDAIPWDTFQVNSSGAVIVKGPLNSLPSGHGSLEVVISDCGQPPLSISVGVFLVFT